VVDTGHRPAIVALAGWITDAINADRPAPIDRRRREILELALDDDERELREEIELEDDDTLSDELKVANWLAAECADDPSEALAQAHEVAETIVRGQWDRIEAVATELLAAEPRTTPPSAIALLGVPDRSYWH
jgi:hypothetical protein